MQNSRKGPKGSSLFLESSICFGGVFMSFIWSILHPSPACAPPRVRKFIVEAKSSGEISGVGASGRSFLGTISWSSGRPVANRS